MKGLFRLSGVGLDVSSSPPLWVSGLEQASTATRGWQLVHGVSSDRRASYAFARSFPTFKNANLRPTATCKNLECGLFLPGARDAAHGHDGPWTRHVVVAA